MGTLAATPPSRGSGSSALAVVPMAMATANEARAHFERRIVDSDSCVARRATLLKPWRWRASRALRAYRPGPANHARPVSYERAGGASRQDEELAIPESSLFQSGTQASARAAS